MRLPRVRPSGSSFVALSRWTVCAGIAPPLSVMCAVQAVASATGDMPEMRAVTSATPAALLAAAVTVVAFDIGMVGWMVVLHLNDLMPPVSEGAFWFLMQVGVMIGLATGYPVVKWLLDRSQDVVPA